MALQRRQEPIGRLDNTTPVEPPKTPEEGYQLTEDLADHAINYIRTQKSLVPDELFFIYFAPGATHAPHHVPPEWIERHKGKFAHGWDRQHEITFARQKEQGVIPQDAGLTPRPEGLPAWDEQDERLKPVLERQMETSAAFLSHTDHHVGRVIVSIEELGLLEDTLASGRSRPNAAPIQPSSTSSGKSANTRRPEGSPETYCSAPTPSPHSSARRKSAHRHEILPAWTPSAGESRVEDPTNPRSAWQFRDAQGVPRQTWSRHSHSSPPNPTARPGLRRLLLRCPRGSLDRTPPLRAERHPGGVAASVRDPGASARSPRAVFLAVRELVSEPSQAWRLILWFAPAY